MSQQKFLLMELNHHSQVALSLVVALKVHKVVVVVVA
jgi:hypothetical protein